MTAETASAGAAIRGAWPLLASVGLLMVGGGLQGSLLGVRAESAGFSAAVTGAILGLYYLGYVAGSLWVPARIRAVGHIRTFASLASLASAAVMVHAVWVSPVPWILLRFLTGVCIAGLFIVSEAWLNDVSTAATRGTLLATYNTVVTAGLTAGTLLLNSADVSGFVLFAVGSVLLSLAVVPVSLAPHDAPRPKEQQPRSLKAVIAGAPLGIAGAVLSGFGTGTALGFGAVYASRAGFGVSGASQFVAAVLVGGVIGQVPLGRWSDRTDRRLVMAVAALLVAGGSGLATVATAGDTFVLALAGGAAIGAGAFSMYGLSFSHVADYVAPELMVATGARIITTNGFGAAAGPIVAAIAVDVVGPEATFVLLGVVAVAFVGLVGYRLTRRGPVSDARRASYAPMATSATVGVIEDFAAEVTADVEVGTR